MCHRTLRPIILLLVHICHWANYSQLQKPSHFCACKVKLSVVWSLLFSDIDSSLRSITWGSSCGRPARWEESQGNFSKNSYSLLLISNASLAAILSKPMPRPRPSTLMVLVLCKPQSMLLCERTLDPAVPRCGVWPASWPEWVIRVCTCRSRVSLVVYHSERSYMVQKSSARTATWFLISTFRWFPLISNWFLWISDHKRTRFPSMLDPLVLTMSTVYCLPDRSKWQPPVTWAVSCRHWKWATLLANWLWKKRDS